MKQLRFVFGVLFLLLAFVSEGQQGSYVRKVVIDAGHGGKDPGALGRRSKEKDIALSIALKTGAYINKYLPDVEVIYTRDNDEFIELHRRAEIANSNNADLFISIHCNANRSSQPYGSETYVMGLHKSQANLEVAKKENSAILLEENYREEYDGFDPNSDEGYISLSLLQNEHLDQSIKMADLVQEQFRERVGRRDRSVRQAGFLVLYRTTMPGVLIETGFLSNRKEESFLISEKGQVYIASAIFRAFRNYKEEMEKGLPKKEVSHVVVQENHPEKEKTKAQATEVYFSVQIDTSPEKLKTTPANFKNLKGVEEYYHSGLYKYTYGKTTSLPEAHRIQSQMRRKGFDGAFTVAFKAGERISISDALELLKHK